MKSGQKVLDGACGIGIPLLSTARLVVPDGLLVGIDLAPGMVEFPRSRAAEIGLQHVESREADAKDLPFSDAFFDVVLCKLSLIHFTDRVQALREMWRVLKGDGVLALSVWSTPDPTMVVGIASPSVAELWPAAVVPGTPRWFDFGPEGALKGIL